MSIFSPPTDSVYKFMAVGGLISSVFLFYIMSGDIDSNGNKRLEVIEQQEVLSKEYQFFIDDLKFNSKYSELPENVDKAINKLWGYSQDSLLNDSTAKFVVHNLPHSIQSELKKLVLKNEVLKAKDNTIDRLVDSSDWDSKFLFILLSVCIFLCLFGFANWYIKIQKPMDEDKLLEQNTKYIEGNFWGVSCQSCFKTFLKKEDYGKNLDKTPNRLYCNECYDKGSFIEPELIFKEAHERLEKNLKNLKYDYITRKRVKNKLKTLIRWSRDFKW